MEKLINKVYSLLFLCFAVLAISGCAGGGSGGGSLGFLGDIFGGSGGGGSVGGGSSSLVSVSNPEPSTLILLGSGLIGMAIYARARLKGKGKR